METILTVKNEDIQRFDAKSAVIFFREVLWAEARRIGIPLHSINVSSEVDTPDQGVDASVSEAIPNDKSDLIQSGHNSYQIKTGSTFSPWQFSQIQKELFGTKQTKRENLRERVRACLDTDGIYVLVCFGQDLTDDRRQKARLHLEQAFKLCGYQAPRVDVWSINNLVGFLEPFPSLALRANQRYYGKFETHAEWGNHDDMRTTFAIGARRQDLLVALRDQFTNFSQSSHVRVFGEPGIGKTRLVLEATSTDDLRPLVIYTNASNFKDSDLMIEMLRSNFSAILVIDECDLDTRATFGTVSRTVREYKSSQYTANLIVHQECSTWTSHPSKTTRSRRSFRAMLSQRT